MKTMSVLLAGAALLAASGAAAQGIVPTGATASSSFSGYEAGFAVDTGANSANTDWASNGGGVGSFLNLDLGATYLLGSAIVTDRTTSGGPNGSFFGGTFDYTTSFSLSYYADASFTGTPVQTYAFNRPAPTSTSSPAGFAYTADLAGSPAVRYIRYTVLAANGSNPGLSDIRFNAAVPEPATWGMMILGFGMIGLGMRRKASVRTAVRFA